MREIIGDHVIRPIGYQNISNIVPQYVDSSAACLYPQNVLYFSSNCTRLLLKRWEKLLISQR